MAYNLLGITDEVTVCECCGRSDLKKTLVLDDGGATVYYGSECGARAMKTTVNKVRRDVTALRQQEQLKARRERHIRRNREADKWDRFLDEMTGKPGASTLEKVRLLGGIGAASKLYESWR